MGLDYYSALGLSRSAQDADIKKAYRKLALKYHPAKNGSPDAVSEFARVCEAYDVLSTPECKGFYDLHGEAALKTGMSDGAGGTKGGFYTFSPAQSDAVFASFFGTENPFEALEDLAMAFQSLKAQTTQKPGRKQVHRLPVTLEELQAGCLKKVHFERKRVAASGTEVQAEQRELTVGIKPGMPEGTCFVFEGEGNVVPGTAPGPVVFVLETQPHARFSRNGADLVYKAKVPLHAALAGDPIHSTLLDGTAITVPVDTILTPGHKVTVPGKGLPNPAAGPNKRGDLVLEIEVLFPAELSQMQTELVRAAVFLPKAKERCDAVKAFQRAFEDPNTGWATGVLKQH